MTVDTSTTALTKRARMALAERIEAVRDVEHVTDVQAERMAALMTETPRARAGNGGSGPAESHGLEIK